MHVVQLSFLQVVQNWNGGGLWLRWRNGCSRVSCLREGDVKGLRGNGIFGERLEKVVQWRKDHCGILLAMARRQRRRRERRHVMGKGDKGVRKRESGLR